MTTKTVLLVGAICGLLFSLLSSSVFALQLMKKKKFLYKIDSYMLTWIPIPIVIVLYYLVIRTSADLGLNMVLFLLIAFSFVFAFMCFLFYKYEHYLTKIQRLEESSKAVLLTTIMACSAQVTLMFALVYLLFVESVS